MTSTTYAVPDNPADPEAAALELIVRVPADLLGHDSPARDALQDFTSLLHAKGCFAGMSWHDARHVAAAIAFDACWRDDAAGVLRGRAARLVDDTTAVFDDREAMARALIIGAEVLGL